MRNRRHAIHMLTALVTSVVCAALIIYSGVVHTLIISTANFAYVGSFIAGLFFTSILTTAPATAVLGALSLEVPLWSIALFGAVGAVCGDYVLFWLIRDQISKDVEYLVLHSGLKRFQALFKTRLFHRLLPFVGALIIASPLPDELGLALLGISNVRPERFMLISFVMNYIGILMIGFVARSLGTM